MVADGLEPSIKDFAPPAVHNWTGPYVGGHIGVASAEYKSAQTADGDLAAVPPDIFTYPGGRDRGFFGGVQAGYDWQMNSFVLGIVGDLGSIGVNGTTTLPAHGGDDGSDVSSVKYGMYGVIAGRLGLAVDRTMFYIKGGAAFAKIRNRSYELMDDGVTIEFDEDHNHDGTKNGWALGGGIEYAFANNWSAEVEYLRMDFGTEKVHNLEGDTIEFNNQVDAVKFG